MDNVIPALIGIGGSLFVSVIAFAFGYGKLSQRVKDIGNKQSDPHSVLPECLKTFNELNSGIAEVKGKVDTLIEMTKGKGG